MNVVPTPATRRLAARMIADAQRTTGADACAKHLADVWPEQLPALLGVLLTATKAHRKIGRPRLPLRFTPAERRELYRRYRLGDVTDLTREGYREYQRVNKQRHRDRRTA